MIQLDSRQTKYALGMAFIILFAALSFACLFKPISAEYVDTGLRIVLYENVSCGIIPPEIEDHPGNYMMFARDCATVCPTLHYGNGGCNYPDKAAILSEIEGEMFYASVVSLYVPGVLFWVLFAAAMLEERRRGRRAK